MKDKNVLRIGTIVLICKFINVFFFVAIKNINSSALICWRTTKRKRVKSYLRNRRRFQLTQSKRRSNIQNILSKFCKVIKLAENMGKLDEKQFKEFVWSRK